MAKLTGKEMNESRAKIMHKWGFSNEEIQAVIGMPDSELKRVLGDGVKADKTEK